MSPTPVGSAPGVSGADCRCATAAGLPHWRVFSAPCLPFFSAWEIRIRARKEIHLPELKRPELSVRQERAVLVGVILPHSPADPRDPLAELGSLAKTAGA